MENDKKVEPRRLKAVVQWIVKLWTTRDTQCSLCFMVRTTHDQILGSKTMLIRFEVEVCTRAHTMNKPSHKQQLCASFAVASCLLATSTFALFVSFSGSATTAQSSSDQNPSVINSLVVIFLSPLLRFNLFSVKHNNWRWILESLSSQVLLPIFVLFSSLSGVLPLLPLPVGPYFVHDCQTKAAGVKKISVGKPF